MYMYDEYSMDQGSTCVYMFESPSSEYTATGEQGCPRKRRSEMMLNNGWR
jgi:hypothetical protein